MATQNRKRRRKTPPRSGTPFRLNLNFRRKTVDFKPDSLEAGFLRKLYMTRQQRFALLKWVLYAAVLIGLLVIQDVIMSRVVLFGTTTELTAGAILLITVMEGVDTGSLFVFLTSALYYFSGSSPGPWSVLLLTFTGIGACLFRQMFWRRSRGSVVLCSATAMLVYELVTCLIGIFQGLTHWGRLPAFLGTALLSSVAMLPLYSLINVIGQIGGNTWKE